MSLTRTTRDARILVERASRRTGKVPKVIIADKLQAYLDGIELAFGAETRHITAKGLTGSKNIIERFHGTLKARTKVMRGLKTRKSAKLFTDAFLVHYNFFKEHEALGNIPPAQKMGIPTPFKDWEDVVREHKVILTKAEPIMPIREDIKVKSISCRPRLRRAQKPKAKRPKRKALPQPSVTMIKGIRL